MDLRDLFDKHRDYYLTHFRSAVATLEGGVSELLIELNNADEEPEILFRLYRFDYITNLDTQPEYYDINLEGALKHNPVEYNFHQVQILIRPLVWNSCDIAVDAAVTDWSDFHDWIRKWIDIADEKPEDEEGFQGVIHNVAKPQFENGWTITSVDLGTAPADALIELMAIFLKNPGVRNVRIGSPAVTLEKLIWN